MENQTIYSMLTNRCLRQLCSECGIKKYSVKNKTQMVDILMIIDPYKVRNVHVNNEGNLNTQITKN